MENRYKVVMCDMDDTLIKTASGNTFPIGIWDMALKTEVFDKIKQLSPEYVFIVTNQGGVGKFVSEQSIDVKTRYVAQCMRDYIGCETDFLVCTSDDKSCPDRKPNIGMGIAMLKKHSLLNLLDGCGKQEVLMVGDASGKPGDFSDSDKKFAENMHIEYIDVDDLVSM